MASRFQLLLILSLLLLCLTFPSVSADDGADQLLQRINSYRLSLRMTTLAKNNDADCVADQIAEQLEDQPCPPAITPRLPEAQFESYPKQLDKCHLSLNTTRDGAILLSCIPSRSQSKSVETFNFTDPLYTTFLNNSKYIGAGVGSEDDWIVVVLTTNTLAGSFITTSSAVGNVFSQLVFVYIGVGLLLGLCARH